MRQSESALLIPVPEAEPLVGRFRERYDSSAPLGVPAHVTVLYPFVPPGWITAATLEQLAELLTDCPSFEFELAELRRFPGVLYLAPRPDTHFRSLTQRVFEAFPEHPPYGGVFDDVIPHLTIADVPDPDALADVTEEVQRALAGRLPMRARAQEVLLMETSGGRWWTRLAFHLPPA